jgi:ribonuclease E
MFSPTVQLRSGGYIVINQTEALVSIDVNSGRSTREHHIEDTALKTNLEASEEVARQLRLRDLAGLIVIDFIDMDEKRNNRAVERKLSDCLRQDRARIQVGRISHFGLLEMSRQRIRSSVLESSTEKCPLCGGSGHVRSVSSVALQLLRAIEEMMIKGATHNLIVRTRTEVALYVLNHKRAHLRELEERFRLTITVSADATVTGQQSYVIDRGEQVNTLEAARSLAAAQPQYISTIEEEDIGLEEVEAESNELGTESEAAQAQTPGERDGEHRRRRRGRGRGRGGEVRASAAPFTHETVAEHAIAHEDHDSGSLEEEGLQQPHEEDSAHGAEGGQTGEDGRRRRRRGRRGGRRNRSRNGEGSLQSAHGNEAEPAYANDFVQHPVVSDEDASAVAPPFNERPTAKAAPVSQSASVPPMTGGSPATMDQEAPRRRSTIREPAPIATKNTMRTPAAPPPSPAVSSTASEEPATPKRGWWAKRLLGDKD